MAALSVYRKQFGHDMSGGACAALPDASEAQSQGECRLARATKYRYTGAGARIVVGGMCWEEGGCREGEG